MLTSQLPAGWALVPGAGRRHYFAGGSTTSLCGRWGPQVEAQQRVSEDLVVPDPTDCHVCHIRFDAQRLAPGAAAAVWTHQEVLARVNYVACEHCGWGREDHRRLEQTYEDVSELRDRYELDCGCVDPQPEAMIVTTVPLFADPVLDDQAATQYDPSTGTWVYLVVDELLDELLGRTR